MGGRSGKGKVQIHVGLNSFYTWYDFMGIVWHYVLGERGGRGDIKGKVGLNSFYTWYNFIGIP